MRLWNHSTQLVCINSSLGCACLYSSKPNIVRGQTLSTDHVRKLLSLSLAYFCLVSIRNVPMFGHNLAVCGGGGQFPQIVLEWPHHLGGNKFTFTLQSLEHENACLIWIFSCSLIFHVAWCISQNKIFKCCEYLQEELMLHSDWCKNHVPNCIKRTFG